MKKWIAVLFILMAAVSAACAEDAAGAPGILVAFFSRAGENYNVGIPKEGSPSASYAGYIEKGNTYVRKNTDQGRVFRGDRGRNAQLFCI